MPSSMRSKIVCSRYRGPGLHEDIQRDFVPSAVKVMEVETEVSSAAALGVPSSNLGLLNGHNDDEASVLR